MLRRVALTLFASGCLLFPTLDGLTGGEDGGPDVIGTSDVTNETSSNDAGFDAPSDVTQSDVVVLPDAEAGPFCAQHSGATFCADFDENADASAGFSTTYLTTGGVLSRDTAIYSTPPASLLAGNSTLDASSSSHGAEVRNTGVTPQNGTTLDFDIRVDKLASQGTYIEALALVFNASPKSSIQLNLKAASSEVGEEIDPGDGGAKTYVAHPLSGPAPPGTWLHVTIALVFKPTRTLTVTVAQNVIVDHATLNAAFSGAGTVDLYLGSAYAPGPSDGATIHYDNALLVVN